MNLFDKRLKYNNLFGDNFLRELSFICGLILFTSLLLLVVALSSNLSFNVFQLFMSREMVSVYCKVVLIWFVLRLFSFGYYLVSKSYWDNLEQLKLNKCNEKMWWGDRINMVFPSAKELSLFKEVEIKK